MRSVLEAGRAYPRGDYHLLMSRCLARTRQLRRRVGRMDSSRAARAAVELVPGVPLLSHEAVIVEAQDRRAGERRGAPVSRSVAHHEMPARSAVDDRLAEPDALGPPPRRTPARRTRAHRRGRGRARGRAGSRRSRRARTARRSARGRAPPMPAARSRPRTAAASAIGHRADHASGGSACAAQRVAARLQRG